MSASLTALLCGCAALPSSGPTASEIVHAQKTSNPIGFQIIDISPMLSALDGPAPAEPLLSGLSRPGAVDRVGPGDVLQITVFEVGTTLFTGGGAAAAQSRQGAGAPPQAEGENLPLVTVEQDGAVILPYVGRIEAAGHTLSEIQDLIAKGLKGKSQTPQVIVSVRENVATTVVVMGEVKKPGRIPLSRAQDRVLDAVAGGGGLNYPLQDMVVQVTRDGRSASARLDGLSAASPDNILLQPQDRIQLFYRPLTFTIFGAAGKVSQQPFQTPKVNLAEAIAQGGGPVDQQADPRAVFVFRYSKIDMDGAPTPAARPIAYRLDLTRPESYFLAQTFEMHPHDVVYIANARANQPAKLLQILNLFFSPIYTAKVVSQ